MKNYMMIGVALIALTGCDRRDTATSKTPDSSEMTEPVDATASTTPGTDVTAMPTDAATYAAKAGAGDLWEIESSKALLAKSGDADIKSFAQMMIDHHTASTEKIKAAAKAANLTLSPPKLDADQQKMLDEIHGADAKDIDRVYLAHQRTAHDKALLLHSSYAVNGDTDSFKKAASEIKPVVEQHISKLKQLEAKPG